MDNHRSRHQIVYRLMLPCGQNEDERQPAKQQLHKKPDGGRKNTYVALPIELRYSNFEKMVADGAAGEGYQPGLQDKNRAEDQRNLSISVRNTQGITNN